MNRVEDALRRLSDASGPGKRAQVREAMDAILVEWCGAATESGTTGQIGGALDRVEGGVRHLQDVIMKRAEQSSDPAEAKALRHKADSLEGFDDAREQWKGRGT